MKKYRILSPLILSLTSALLALGSPSILSAQQPELVYRLGLEQRPTSPTSWGQGAARITALQPESPATRAGLRVGDLLLSIDGVGTAGLSAREVDELLQRPTGKHLVTLRRLGQPKPETLLLIPEAKSRTARTERELARAYAAYSPEDQAEWPLSYQLSYQVQPGFDFATVRRYAFAPSSEQNRELDDTLYSMIARQLQALGLQEDKAAPDLIIECYYELQPTASPRLDAAKPAQSLRYHPEEERVQFLPIIPEAGPDEGSYQVKLSVQMTRPTDPQRPVWLAETREGLSEPMTLKDFARYTLPVMLRPFPFAPSGSRQHFIARRSRYLYTGLHYALQDLGRVVEVEEASPAFTAGLQPGDRILAINGRTLGDTDLTRLSEEHHRFVRETESYREAGPLGYWSPKSYGALRKAFASQPYSYLFAFRPYVREESGGLLTLEIERSGERYTLQLQPELREESTLIPLDQ